jgi:hypothetical protein
MEYLLIDAHQRFLGTFRSDRMLAVGDTFQHGSSQTYAVVGINWSQARIHPEARRLQKQALTVVAVNRGLCQQPV